MRITDLLKKESIDLNGVVTTKKETIEKMTLLMEKERPESGKESLFHMQRQMR